MQYTQLGVGNVVGVVGIVVVVVVVVEVEIFNLDPCTRSHYRVYTRSA